MAAVCGLLMVALPVSVVATNFSIYYSYAKARISLPPKKEVKVAKEANDFLGHRGDTPDEKLFLKKNNRVSPIHEEAESTDISTETPLKHCTDEVQKKRNLPPLKRTSSHRRFDHALGLMRDQGLLKINDNKKMDLPSLVVALSSKGDWTSPPA